ncbi:MAG TPA: DUF2142 domain-containing protein [Leptospiraceae bacterium]|nr:DUF2142 domain-containing protein [Leptospiraceae bacterium]HNL74785.1 DUF2142 domain-containing protein [Leptospiraceae bacterium]
MFSKINYRHFVWLLCILTGLRIFVGNAAFPFFNNVDEHAHFDTIMKYAKGDLPSKENLRFEPESARFIVLYGSPEYFYRAENYTSKEIPLPNWKLGEAVNVDYLSQEWLDKKNHEVFSPPVYYSFLGFWFHVGKWMGLEGGYQLYWLRFLNLFIYISIFWIVYWMLGVFWHDNLYIRTSVLLLVTVFPQDVFYTLNSDTLSALFCLLSFFFLMEIYFTNKSYLFYFLAGSFTAMAFLTKVSNVPLITLVGLILFLRVIKLIRSQQMIQKEIVNLIIFVLSTSIPVFVWFLWNQMTIGEFTGTAEKMRDLDWTYKPITEIFNHPIFTLKGFTYFFSSLFKTFWRGELVWGLREMAAKDSDRLYTYSILLVIASGFNSILNKQAYSDRIRFVQILSFIYIIISVLFLLLLSMIYDFGKCWYPSRENPFFTSGRLMIGMMIPFLILFVDGIRIFILFIENLLNWILSFINKRFSDSKTKIQLSTTKVLIGFILLICFLISQYETKSLWMVMQSKYNWFFL